SRGHPSDGEAGLDGVPEPPRQLLRRLHRLGPECDARDLRQGGVDREAVRRTTHDSAPEVGRFLPGDRPHPPGRSPGFPQRDTEATPTRTTSGPIAIEAFDVSHAFGGVEALRAAMLSASFGEVHALV